MVRTQIYLTEEEQEGLRALATRTGRSQSDLIREAIDAFLARRGPPERLSMLREGRGLWRGRVDLPDLQALRRELEQSGEGPR